MSEMYSIPDFNLCIVVNTLFKRSLIIIILVSIKVLK